MKDRSRPILVPLLIVTLLVFAGTTARASTEAQKAAAIAGGLAYLAATQNADGSWPGAFGYPIAATASSLLSFEEQYYKQGNSWGALPDYSNVVTKAANYILGQTQAQSLAAPNWWGFTGSNPDKTGLYWAAGLNDEEVYQTGLVMPALSRLTNGINGITPGTVITSLNPNVNGKTYQDVLQRTVDLFAWGQNGPANGWADGGWRYVVPSPNDADGSTSQWPALGMLFAQNVPGVSVPNQTKAELVNWINTIQAPDGSCWYTPGYLADESKTGGLLLKMALAGGGGNQALAIDYINNNWLNPAGSHDAPWGGNFAHPYAMWSIYKGLEVTIGLNNMSAVTNLHANPGDVDNPNHGWNWWEDYCNSLVLSQNGDGSWGGYSYWDFGLATPWNINILNATSVPGGVVPEPATLLLLGFGLAGLGVAARRRKL